MLGFPIFGQFYHFLVACLTEFYVHTQATLPVSPFLQDMPSPTSSRQIEWGRFQADSLKPVHPSCELHEKEALSLPGLELPSSWMGVGGGFLAVACLSHCGKSASSDTFHCQIPNHPKFLGWSS